MAPKSAVWTYEKEEFLITYMESRRFMWDPKHRDYFKSERKAPIFEDCAIQLGPQFTALMVKERWNNIKTTFMANHKKVTARIADGAEESTAPVPTWPLYKRLLFLSPSLIWKRHISTPSKPREKTEPTEESYIHNVEDPIQMVEIIPDMDNERPCADSPETVAPYNHLPVEVELGLGGYKRSCAQSSTLPGRLCEDDHDTYAKCARKSPSPLVQSQNSQNSFDRAFNVIKETLSGSDDKLDKFDHMGAVVAHSLRDNMDPFSAESAFLEIQKILLKYNKYNPHV